MRHLNVEDIGRLLGMQPPGTPIELSALCHWMNKLVKRHGSEWVSQNREQILAEWEFILDFKL